MSMPEASVNEDDRFPLWKNYVWIPWQIIPVQPKAIAHPVKHAPDNSLRLSVLSRDPPHDLRTPFFRENIHVTSSDQGQ
jgi:hypothetical protein